MQESEIILNKNSFVNELNQILKNGGVIAFVTDTVWGLGCLPSSKQGVEKIYEIKDRDKSKPLILMSDEQQNLMPYIKNVSQTAENLMKDYFPGALTVIAEKSELTPLYCTSGKNTVGVRVPDNTFFKKLCSVIDGHVLATTSANHSNCPSSKTYEQAVKSIGDVVDYVFPDYGFECQGLESTVVLAVDEYIKILRQGAVKLL